MLTAWSATARAEVRLVPAQDGSLGAWLVSGPIPGSRQKTLDAGSVEPKAGAAPDGLPRFSLIAARDGALDLDKALRTDKKKGALALLGGELRLARDLDGWLLASVDGPATVYVDGKQIARRPWQHLRGQAVDAFPLVLGKGAHQVVLELEHPGTWWALELRVLDRRDLLPPRDMVLDLPGTSERDATRLAREMLSATLDSGLANDGYHPELSLEYRRGAPFSAAPAVVIDLGAGKAKFPALAAGALPLGARGVSRFDVTLPLVAASDLSANDTLAVTAKIGDASVRLKAGVSAELPALLARAEKAEANAKAGTPHLLDAETVGLTLQARANDVRHDGPTRKSELEKLLNELEAGKDPMADHGVLHLARRSVLDAAPDPIFVHVPATYSPGTQQRFPLVIALHGLNGNPQGIMDAFLDDKSGAPKVDGFVAAPHAHGNAFYRGPGELEVMAALDWMLKTYPIDPERVSITGVSMGGTGTAHLGLWYADRFSAAAPLCGYQSFFVRRDTAKRPIRPWETERMHHWSPTSWAERGNNLPMWVAQGTKDFPLENSRVLVNRYKELGYSMTDEWPDTGHDVWTKTYAGARLWPWLSKKRRDPAPAEVHVKTDQLRFGHLDWVTLTRLAKVDQIASCDAKAESPTHIVVHTDSVDAFELERRAPTLSSGALEVEVDGKKLSFAAGEKITLDRESGEWQKGAPKPSGKKAGLEGPIRDAYLEPLVFVYGSLDPRTLRANREVAEAFAHARHGPEADYRVIADRDLDQATLASHGVFAVGTPADNLVLGKAEKSLPIRVDGKKLAIGDKTFEKPGTGAIFVMPNPEAPERYLVVVTGVDAAGIWRALSLPQLLPDFLVYDDALSPAAGEVVLGADAHVLAGGFFDRDWKLPAHIEDAP